MNKTLRFGFLGLALGLLSCSSSRPLPEAALQGRPAPNFNLVGDDGRSWSAAAGGKAMLIDFWAVWCQPCLAAIPDLNAFQELHKDKLSVLGVCIEPAGWSKVRPLMQSRQIRYPVALGTPAIAAAYGVEGFPYLVLVSEGKIVKQLLGRHSLAQLESELAEFLASAPK
jgi:thiol-disulfide isomerase/thioredoxin